MNQNNKKLKEEIKRISMELTKFYNEASETQQDSLLIGKKEAYEEVLNWIANNHNSDFRYINTNTFLSMIQDKITKSKSALQNSGAENSEEDRFSKPVNFSQIRIQESRKRVNKYANDYYNSNVDNNDYMMEYDDRPMPSPFKLYTHNNVENTNNTFQNNNIGLWNNYSNNEGSINNEVNNTSLTNNIFFPLKKEKK